MMKTVPLRVRAVQALIALLAAALIYQTLALAYLRADHARYVSEVKTAMAEASETARAEEQRRQREINQVRNDAQEQIKAAAADAAVAASAADGLQQQVDKLLAGRRACDTRVAERGRAIADLTAVLADLRRRADERAGELARIADESRIAGLACERAYSALRILSAVSPAHKKVEAPRKEGGRRDAPTSVTTAKPQTIPASPAKAPALCTKPGEPSTCLFIQ